MKGYRCLGMLETAWLLTTALGCSDSGRGINVDTEVMTSESGPSQPAFNAPKFYPVDGAQQLLGTADFNGDNKLDLVITNSKASTVGIVPGDGAGGFGTGRYFSLPSHAGALAIADFDRDGKPDLAIHTDRVGVSILLNDGSGGFSAPKNAMVGSRPYTIAVGDFNLDTKPDLAVTIDNNSASIVLGDGLGQFGAATVFAADARLRGSSAVGTGDFNLDGKPDLVMAWDGISVLLGDGTGSFGTASWYKARRMSGMQLADLNLDGKLDIVTVREDGGVLLGDGRGGFGPEIDLRNGLDAYTAAVADFNGDQKPDLAFSSMGEEWQIFVMPGDGQGHFFSPTKLNTHWLCAEMVVGDFNNDQKPDLVVSHGIGVSILLGRGGTTYCEANQCAVVRSP